MRVIIAGVVGGIAMFIWSSIAHIATPLGNVGMSGLPDEATTLPALEAALGDKAGLYFFPWTDMNDPKAADIQEEKLKSHAFGLLIYNPPGSSAGMTPKQLLTEFAAEVIEALMIAWAVSLAAPAGFAARVMVAAPVTVAAIVTTNLSYWNWYGFPSSYTLAYGFIQLVGYAVAALVVAAIVKPAD